MPVLPSATFKHHVIFHCPVCFADRIARKRFGTWVRWPTDDSMVGSHVQCTACDTQADN